MTEVLDDAITAEFKNYISKKDLEVGRLKITRSLQLMNGYIKYLNSLVKK